jgi:hypothetical protein
MSVSTQNGHSNFERGGHFQRVIQLKRGDAIWHLSNVRFGRLAAETVPRILAAETGGENRGRSRD